ncbi:MAG: hypothetical protein AAB657_00740 [Patescibacteria group bacterium]
MLTTEGETLLTTEVVADSSWILTDDGRKLFMIDEFWLLGKLRKLAPQITAPAPPNAPANKLMMTTKMMKKWGLEEWLNIVLEVRS